MNSTSIQFRVGQGFDVHAFGAGDHVFLCGEKIGHTRGLLAHSDGDVGLHALCDAMLAPPRWETSAIIFRRMTRDTRMPTAVN